MQGNFFKEKNILVTGGTGLIGRQVVSKLLEQESKITIVSLDQVKVDDRVELIFGDLTDLNFCKEITSSTDYVCHLAGIKASIEISKSHLASHFVPTLMMNCNLLEAAFQNQVKGLVYTSSIGAYPADESILHEGIKYEKPPMDFAGWAKRMGELQIHAYQVQHGLENFAVVRLPNVYGPGDNFDPQNAMVVASLMARIKAGEKPLNVWGDGTAKRDFLFSADAAEGILLALQKGTRGEFVNIGSGKAIPISELVETLAEITDVSYKFDTSKPSGAPLKLLEIKRAKEWLNYKPKFSLKEGLKETWDWYSENEGESEKRKNYFT